MTDSVASDEEKDGTGVLTASSETRRTGDQSPIFKPADPAKALDFLFGEEPDEKHALDDAPVNSKIVVIRMNGKRIAVLAMPHGEPALPDDDIAARFPEGTKVYKVADGDYRSNMPDPYGYCSLADESADALLRRMLVLLETPPKSE
jgi:hypothetical protein